MIEIRHYTTASGEDVFETWLGALKDVRTQARIAARLDCLAIGNFGDCKPVGAGVSELRLNFGPVYRVYFATVGRTCVLLLAGGDKRRQSADIARAIERLRDYQRRSARP